MAKRAVHAVDSLNDVLCPFMAGVIERRVSFFGKPKTPWNCQACVGPRCMAWRWAETHILDEERNFVPSDNSYGYCGLAGRPE